MVEITDLRLSEAPQVAVEPDPVGVIEVEAGAYGSWRAEHHMKASAAVVNGKKIRRAVAVEITDGIERVERTTREACCGAEAEAQRGHERLRIDGALRAFRTTKQDGAPQQQVSEAVAVVVPGGTDPRAVDLRTLPGRQGGNIDDATQRSVTVEHVMVGCRVSVG